MKNIELKEVPREDEYFSLRELKEMDTIIWNDENTKHLEQYISKNDIYNCDCVLFINEGVLKYHFKINKINKVNLYIYFNFNENTKDITMNTYGYSCCEYKFYHICDTCINLERFMSGNVEKTKVRFLDKELCTPEIGQEMNEEFNLLVNILFYLTDLIKNRNVTFKHPNIKKIEGSNISKSSIQNKKRTLKLDEITFYLKEESYNNLIGRHYERHTEGWTVRGHYRTYKSGKKTWIKPQVRGDKEKITGKIYEV